MRYVFGDCRRRLIRGIRGRAHGHSKANRISVKSQNRPFYLSK